MSTALHPFLLWRCRPVEREHWAVPRARGRLEVHRLRGEQRRGGLTVGRGPRGPDGGCGHGELQGGCREVGVSVMALGPLGLLWPLWSPGVTGQSPPGGTSRCRGGAVVLCGLATVRVRAHPQGFGAAVPVA